MNTTTNLAARFPNLAIAMDALDDEQLAYELEGGATWAALTLDTDPDAEAGLRFYSEDENDLKIETTDRGFATGENTIRLTNPSEALIRAAVTMALDLHR